MSTPYIFLIILLGAALYYDYKETKIPNWLTVAGMATGLGYYLLGYGINGIWFSLQGLAAGFLILLVIYLLGGIGAGDVKLFAAIGAMGGVQTTLYILSYSIICAAVIGLIWVTLRGELIMRIKNVLYLMFCLLTFRKPSLLRDFKETQGFRFPFMYAVIPGAITSFFYMPVW
jgi:prepilin peptidase CpaA